jgi:anti-sigma factor RsiW
VVRDLNHSEIMDLLGAYALDAVDDDERQAIERHLDNCAQCRREVAEHREVAGMLASGWLPAPEGLWDRIAGSLEEPPPPLRMPSEAEGPAEAPPASGPPPTPPPVVSLDERRGRRSRSGLGRAAAAVAIAASVAVVGVVGVSTLVEDKPDDVTELAAAAADRPGARKVEMRSPDGTRSVEAVVLPDGTGYVVDDNLPELPPDRTYQLWAVVGASKISVGVLGPSVEPLAFRAAADASALAITTERAGGVVASDQQPVVVGTVA